MGKKLPTNYDLKHYLSKKMVIFCPSVISPIRCIDSWHVLVIFRLFVEVIFVFHITLYI